MLSSTKIGTLPGMFPGGIADKLGNGFETKWAVQKLLEVFHAEAVTVLHG
jgi:hypothetical protein